MMLRRSHALRRIRNEVAHRNDHGGHAYHSQRTVDVYRDRRHRSHRKHRFHRVVPGAGSFCAWLIAAAAAWYWALAQGGQAAWFTAAITGFLVLYAGIAGCLGLVKPAVYRDEVSESVQAGDRVKVGLTIRLRSGWFPFVWLVIQDRLYDAEGRTAYTHHRLVYAGSRNRISVEYEIPRLRRGVYTYGAVSVEAAEPLGIIGRRWRMDDASGRRLLVYPQPLAGLAAEMPRRLSESGAAVTAAMAAASPLVSTVRDYAHGDPLQRIHWKSTARTGGLKTKELDALQERRVAVVLDDAAEGYGSGPLGRSRFETAASAACAVVKAAKQQGLAAMLLCGGAEAAAEEAPGPAERRALELLAHAEPRRGGPPLEEVLREQGMRHMADVPLMVITPRLDARLIDQIGALRMRRVNVSLLYISDTEQLDEAESQRLAQLSFIGCSASAIAAHRPRITPPGSISQAAAGGGAGDVGASS